MSGKPQDQTERQAPPAQHMVLGAARLHNPQTRDSAKSAAV
jgi:hypothetical protein